MVLVGGPQEKRYIEIRIGIKPVAFAKECKSELLFQKSVEKAAEELELSDNDAMVVGVHIGCG